MNSPEVHWNISILNLKLSKITRKYHFEPEAIIPKSILWFDWVVIFLPYFCLFLLYFKQWFFRLNQKCWEKLHQRHEFLYGTPGISQNGNKRITCKSIESLIFRIFRILKMQDKVEIWCQVKNLETSLIKTKVLGSFFFKMYLIYI